MSLVPEWTVKSLSDTSNCVPKSELIRRVPEAAPKHSDTTMGGGGCGEPIKDKWMDTKAIRTAPIVAINTHPSNFSRRFCSIRVRPQHRVLTIRHQPISGGSAEWNGRAPRGTQ